MKDTSLAEKALRAVLLFHSGQPWGATEREQWVELCGVDVDATSRTLCDLVRLALDTLLAQEEPVNTQPHSLLQRSLAAARLTHPDDCRDCGAQTSGLCSLHQQLDREREGMCHQCGGTPARPSGICCAACGNGSGFPLVKR